MLQIKNTLGGGSGLKINNAEIVDYIGTDENIDKGKFIEFVSNFGSSNQVIVSGSSYQYVINDVIELSEEKYVLYYRVQTSSSKYAYYAVVVSVADKTVTIGTSVSVGNTQRVVMIDETHTLRTYISSGYVYAVVDTINGTEITIGTLYKALQGIYSPSSCKPYKMPNGNYMIIANINGTTYYTVVSINGSEITYVGGNTGSSYASSTYCFGSAYVHIVFITESRIVCFYSSTDATSYLYVKVIDFNSDYTNTAGTAISPLGSYSILRSLQYGFDIVTEVTDYSVTIVYNIYGLIDNNYNTYDTVGLILSIDGTTLTKKYANYRLIDGEIASAIKIAPHTYLVSRYLSSTSVTKNDANDFAILKVCDNSFSIKLLQNITYSNSSTKYGLSTTILRGKLAVYSTATGTKKLVAIYLDTKIIESVSSIDGITMSNIVNGKGKIAIV